MKKNVFFSLLLVAITSSLAACGGGSSGSSGATTPAASATQLTAPSGYTPTSSNSQVLANPLNNSLAIPTSNGYITATIPTDVMTDIVNSGGNLASLMNKNGFLLVTADSIYWVAVTDISSQIATKSQKISTPQLKNATATATITKLNGPSTSYISSVRNLISQGYNVVTYNPTTNVLATKTPDSNSSVTEWLPNADFTLWTPTIVPLSASCGITESNPVSLVATGNYNNTTFMAVGSNNGTVCVQNGINGGAWTILSNQAPTQRTPSPQANYQAGQLINYGFHDAGSNNYYGYWSVANNGSTSSAANIYRIAGTITSGNYVATSFWNTTTALTQHNASQTQQNTFSNVPTLPNSSYQSCTDQSGNLFVVFSNNNEQDVNLMSVYTLSGTSTGWGNTTQSFAGIQTSGYVMYPDTTAGCDLTVLDTNVDTYNLCIAGANNGVACPSSGS